MDSNCNIITEILLVTLLVTAKSNTITITKLLVNDQLVLRHRKQLSNHLFYG